MRDSFRVEHLFSVEGKAALVTGGSSGLGLIKAKGLLQNGAKVVIASRSKNKIDEALKELAEHGQVFGGAADVTEAEDRRQLLEFVSVNLGCLDILVNNAGSNWGAPLEDYPDDGFEKVINTNLNAVFSLSRDAIPLL